MTGGCRPATPAESGANATHSLLAVSAFCFGLTAVAAGQEPQPLEDNSFLIEEAYNQNPGVVQEISNFVRSSGGSDWVYITQEWPLGATLLPSAENPAGARATTTSINAGASVIWLVRPLFNLILEGVWLSEENVVGPGATDRQASAFFNPGFRWGFNFRRGLQIVTGVAYTASLNDANPDALFVYLSFEHPFQRPPR